MNQHVYIKQRFDQEQTSKLLEVAGPSQQVMDFLTDAEFNLLRSRILDPKLEYPESGKVSKYWGFGPIYEPAKDINPWLIPKIHNLIGPCEIDFYAYQEAKLPWKIHADIRWYPDKIPHKVFLIPLDVEPNSGPVAVSDWPETHTITFSQRNLMRMLPEKNGKAVLGNSDQDSWDRSWDDPCVEDCVPGYHISEDFWSKHLGHVPYDHAEGLTLDGIFKWEPKSIMFWDNTMLHASDDFLGHGIKTKRSFMIFTYL